jgi:enoyl-CoA hydratase/carnithine racemase
MGIAMKFETIKVRQEEAVLFAEISAPPMNLLGPELVRDLVSLIQMAEPDEAVKVLVFKSADPDYFISHVDITRIKEYREGSGEVDRRSFARTLISTPERQPPHHDRADRGSGTRRRQ